MSHNIQGKMIITETHEKLATHIRQMSNIVRSFVGNFTPVKGKISPNDEPISFVHTYVCTPLAYTI